ncbi:hypothetical protein [Thermodesulfovibrio thiophilus]|uniref:hypothetical protein n=1 Tax=Thermodesulfovibrio thiophilus TaxID=340095 RepID=UPI0003FAAD7D|nr:hypothetical protein [Thermodesulfovibrio thiophilus]
MTAKTKDGKEIFRESKIYMPQALSYGRGNFMWSDGAYRGWKSAIIRDTSLQPLQTRIETFEIPFPLEVLEKDGKKQRIVKYEEMNVTIQLWYLPIGGDPKLGTPGKTQFLFYETTKNIKLKPRDSYIQ